jgi:hypothetical protein
MDKEKAKEYLFDDPKSHKIYISKDLQKLMNMNDGELFFIYAVIETESGDTLMEMDWSYSGEPIIMRRFIHKDYLIEYKNKEVITL